MVNYLTGKNGSMTYEPPLPERDEVEKFAQKILNNIDAKLVKNTSFDERKAWNQHKHVVQAVIGQMERGYL